MDAMSPLLTRLGLTLHTLKHISAALDRIGHGPYVTSPHTSWPHSYKL